MRGERGKRECRGERERGESQCGEREREERVSAGEIKCEIS